MSKRALGRALLGLLLLAPLLAGAYLAPVVARAPAAPRATGLMAAASDRMDTLRPAAPRVGRRPAA